MSRPSFPHIVTTITAARMGPGGIHNDDEAARKAGLPGAIVQGSQLTSLLVDMLLQGFGASFVRGGELDVEFRKPVRVGDEITTRARVARHDVHIDGRARVECEIWLENQRTERVVTGTAIGLMPVERE